MKIAIIKYNAGNVQSVTYALQRLGIEPVLTDDEQEIRSADRVIFPGVGEASTAMYYLRKKGLDRIIPTLEQPVLGVCLGLQLMCRYSEENNTECLNIFDLTVQHFDRQKARSAGGALLKIPHMGWNTLTDYKSELLKGLPENAYVYYVHSYYAPVSEYTIATTLYVNPFSAMLHKDNFYACQFHPEKSGEAGAAILANFIALPEKVLLAE
jgi:glutamine amidotransferase